MRQLFEKGFILPATILLGLAVSIISVTFSQYIVSSSATLNSQTYNAIAQEAANSGISYAVGCFSSSVTTWTTLAPNTTCDGVLIPTGSTYIVQSADGTWRSTFTVATPSAPSGQTKIVSTGTIQILFGGAVVKTITATKNVTMTSTLGSTPVSTGLALTDLSTDSHSCAIANGQLYCWGLNDRGQLGTGNTSNYNSPQLVAATNSGDTFYGKTITAIAVGTSNTCATADGQLYCWGDNQYGQLGNNAQSVTPQTSPQLVAALSSRKITNLSLSQSATGPKSACAIADGISYCWGSNSNQQLGKTIGSTVDTTNRLVPTAIYGYNASESGSPLYAKKAQSASVGAHNGCATAQGKMYCWGNITTPTAAAPVTDMSSTGAYPYGPMVLPWSVRVTGDFACSVTSVLVCQGQSSVYGTYSQPSVATYASTIVDYDGGENAASPGDGLFCIASADPYCNGNNTGQSYPGAVTGSSETNARVATKIGTGNQYGCMVVNGGLACWGNESEGQLADGSFTGSSALPKIVAANIIGTDNTLTGTYPRFAATGPISAGTNHECAIANGAIFCWGQNTYGQLGVANNSDQNQPSAIDTSNFPMIFGFIPINVVKEKITSGANHSCAVAGGELYCWGLNSNGQLGINNTTNSNKPINITNGSLGRVTDVSAGARNTCAVANSQLYCWGDQSNGMVGDGQTSGNQLTPKQVVAFSGMQVSTVSVGTNHVCAIVNGDGYCWGSNANYATGQSTSTGITNPTGGGGGKITSGIAGVTNGNVTAAFTQISAGNGFSCAVINGVVGCWGKNDQGQTGTGGTTDVTIPTHINGPAGTMQATSISAGNTHSCATLQGKIYCWGNNSYGKIGNSASSGTELTPVLINGGSAVGRSSVSVAAGGNSTCSVSNAVILCWGAGTYGQIGDNALNDVSAPSAIAGYRTVGTYTTGQVF